MRRLIAFICSDAAHLRMDMQNLFAPGGPWAAPWMARVLPAIELLDRHTPERTVFSRFIPPPNAEQAVGRLEIYLQKRSCVTGEILSADWPYLVSTLQDCVSPTTLSAKP
jgi:nicotinamidase-related amidase